MKANESTRIATLTTGAIKTTSENTIKALADTVMTVESKISEMRTELERCIDEKTREMHDTVQRYVEEVERATGSLANTVSDHVAHCQATIDKFQAYHIGVIDAPAQQAVAPVPHVDDRVMESLTDDIRKLARTPESRRQ